MVQMAISTGTTTTISAVRDEFLKAFRWMLLARLLDDKLASLYRGGARSMVASFWAGARRP